MADDGIVRNRAKIEATIANARAVADLDVDLGELLWSFAPPPRPRPADLSEVPAVTPESKAMAKELKRRGFRFVGPTTAYALMQATGMVDDHVATCWVPAGRGEPRSERVFAGSLHTNRPPIGNNGEVSCSSMPELSGPLARLLGPTGSATRAGSSGGSTRWRR